MTTEERLDECVTQLQEMRNVAEQLVAMAEEGMIPDAMTLQWAKGKLVELGFDRDYGVDRTKVLAATMNAYDVQNLIAEALREERRNLASKIRNAAPYGSGFYGKNEVEDAVKEFAKDLATSLENQCKDEENAR